ncbi:MAG: peptidoglycan DD-metalloendopeptidase family protein, partial [Bacteroidales bacterium]|nr:peptidoglycan DD-metalloendopeptidase family protein [Bacteroidales bacterium]
MNKQIAILTFFLVVLSLVSFSQNANTIDTRSENRRFADSMYAVHNKKNTTPSIPVQRDSVRLDTKVTIKRKFTSAIETKSNNSLSKLIEENQDKEEIVENHQAPCKTLYNNTWCTNKVKMPSFRFGEFPDEFKIKLVDEKKNQNFHFPCKKGVKSSSYGWRWEKPHGGIDFALNVGEPIYAVFDGVIRVAQVNGGYGKMILIRHYNNLETLYGHLDKILVKVGQEVKAGDMIGYSGNTGYSTGPHLHFECRCLYQTFDPEWILDVEKKELRTKKINIEKTFFGIERAEKHLNKKTNLSNLVKVTKTFEGKPYYSFKEKYTKNKNTKYLAKGGNQPVEKYIEINNEDKSKWRYWRVREGDTLIKISQRFNITPSQIIEMNKLKSEN